MTGGSRPTAKWSRSPPFAGPAMRISRGWPSLEKSLLRGRDRPSPCRSKAPRHRRAVATTDRRAQAHRTGENGTAPRWPPPSPLQNIRQLPAPDRELCRAAEQVAVASNAAPRPQPSSARSIKVDRNITNALRATTTMATVVGNRSASIHRVPRKITRTMTPSAAVQGHLFPGSHQSAASRGTTSKTAITRPSSRISSAPFCCQHCQAV